MQSDSILSALNALAFLLASYGVLRESFKDLATPRAYGEGRYGEGTYSGSSGKLVRLGVFLRLLPRDENLTQTDQKRNAACAVGGVVLGVIALLAAIFV